MSPDATGGPPAPTGFIGLGQIGAPMAERLLEWPGGLVVCDVAEEATRPFAERGATVAATPADVARAGAEVISVMVRDDAQVRSVVLGPDGIAQGAKAGTTVAIHSTISADTAVAVAEEAASSGLAVLDVPVTGGFVGALEGTLALIVGGDDDAVERCRPIFALTSTLVVHAGPVGAATRMKVARALLTFAGYAAGAEAQRLAEAAGLSLADLAAIVKHSDAITGGPAAVMIRSSTGPLAPDDGLRPILQHTRDLGEKDLRLAVDLAAELEVDVPMATLALQTLGAALGVPEEGDAG